jgi:hypothetical protein
LNGDFASTEVSSRAGGVSGEGPRDEAANAPADIDEALGNSDNGSYVSTRLDQVYDVGEQVVLMLSQLGQRRKGVVIKKYAEQSGSSTRSTGGSWPAAATRLVYNIAFWGGSVEKAVTASRLQIEPRAYLQKICREQQLGLTDEVGTMQCVLYS